MSSLARVNATGLALMSRTFGESRLALPFAREIFLVETHVAGTAYHQANAVEGSLGPGTPLRLQREPANPHDPLAVAVLYEDRRLGYLPRTLNPIPARLMDAGKLVVASVASVKRRDRWLEVRIAVSLREG